MRTLLFSNQGLSPGHLGIELEILEEEIREGNEIKIIYCKSNLKSCFFNPNHNLLACSICESRSLHFYNKIRISSNQISPLVNTDIPFKTSKIESAQDLFDIEYKGYDIGRGIAASYISVRRNYAFDSEDQEFIAEMANMCVDVIENFESQIEAYQPDKVILFNGRFAEVNAVIEVCTKLGVDYFTFERSSAQGKYKYFKNMLPHSLTHRAVEMKRQWAEGKEPERSEIGEFWFENRITKKAPGMEKFLAKQTSGNLPKNFDESRENVSFFITSEDEHKAIKEHDFPHYKSQNEALTKIFEHFKSNPDIHFYLRVHPHLRNIKSLQTDEIAQMVYPNLTVLNAEDPVDTYELIRKSKRVVSFGSTTGLESTYLGIPSISFGSSYYRSIDCCYYPDSYDELFQLIADTNLVPKKKEETYKFSYYQSTIGIPYTKFDDKGKMESSYAGETMKRVYTNTIPILLRNIKDFGHWKKMNQLIFKEGLNFSNAFQLNSHVLNEKLK